MCFVSRGADLIHTRVELKVHWFRRKAIRDRWAEEVLLTQEEMGRIGRFFKHFEARWTKNAEKLKEEEREAEACYARRYVERLKDTSTH